MMREMNINGSYSKTEGNRALRRYGSRQKNDIKNDLKKEFIGVRTVDFGYKWLSKINS
jgi:hypothetical protein